MQILELEKKVLKQQQGTAKVKRANGRKELEKQVETLELQLKEVSEHFADLWRPRAVRGHTGACAWNAFGWDKGSGANAFG